MSVVGGYSCHSHRGSTKKSQVGCMSSTSDFGLEVAVGNPWRAEELVIRYTGQGLDSQS
jgi:hypothetical protein